MTGDEKAWFRKVDPELVKQYLAQGKQKQAEKRQMRLDFRGSYKKLQSEVEVLSVIDHEWQVLMSLENLPKVASLDETRRIKPA